MNTNNALIIDDIEWQPTVTRNMSFWHQCLSVEGSYKHQRDFGVDSKFDYLSFTVDGVHTTAFGYTENLKEMGVAVLEAVNSDEKIAELERKYVVHGDELKQALQNCLQNLSAETWERFVSLYRLYTAGLIIPTIIGRQGSELLMRKLAESGIAEKDIENTVNIITYPSKHTPLFDSQLELLEIGARVQNGVSGSDTDRALQSWVEKYGHIPVNFCDDPWTIADAQKQLESVMQKDCTAELKRLEQNHEAKVTAVKEELDKISNQEISVLARALQTGTNLNEYRKNVFSWVSLHYRPLFADVARMAGSGSWRDCFYYYPQEMTRILQGEELPMKEMISMRSVMAIKMKDNKLIELESEQTLILREFVQRHQGQATVETSEIQEIKGVIANKGNVRGTVKVVLSSKDFHKINAGDILVTTMTSVDFVPIMEKAAAFVTNEGGITSHAAIVAREMNKPCVIGTKIATQVLRDDDHVEVDANRGIVRKL